jgi:hypothetical protein
MHLAKLLLRPSMCMQKRVHLSCVPTTDCRKRGGGGQATKGVPRALADLRTGGWKVTGGRELPGMEHRVADWRVVEVGCRRVDTGLFDQVLRVKYGLLARSQMRVLTRKESDFWRMTRHARFMSVIIADLRKESGVFETPTLLFFFHSETGFSKDHHRPHF